ncbi:hypothetical protein GCM10023093_13470 [Nemorincola caseinilytica]|uniref:Glycosyltransferase RgtA/B/C/D-like domain-containing protein n=1 Tax=Nemorincola caseinilytica TaxID=2054315 RepID=A0ABP8NAA7_9BACT
MSKIRYSTLAVILLVAIIFIAYAVRVFPIPGTDSSSFLPPSLTFGQGRGLANPIYYLSSLTDATGTLRYNYYVPFYTWFLGFFVAAVPGIKTLFVVCALLTIMALLLYRRTILGSGIDGNNKLLTATILLSIPYLATYSLPTLGRPEQLTAPLSLLLYLLYHHRAKMNTWLYNGLLVLIFALLLTSQITGFYFAFLFFLIAEFLGAAAPGRSVWVNAVRGIAVLLVSYLIMEASPNGFMATVQGISRHSQVLFARTARSIGLFTYYWVLSPFNFGFLIIFLAGMRYWYLYLRSSLPAVGMFNKLVIAALHLAIVAGMLKFVLHTSPTVYNATQYIYVILLILLLNHHRFSGSRYNALVLPSLMLTFIGGGLIFLRTFLLFADNEADGKTYDAAKSKLMEVENKYGKCYTSFNLWALYDDPYRVHQLDERYIKPGDIIVLNQAYNALPASILSRSEILEDWRTTDVRTLLGIPLTRHPQGYSFVVVRVK